MRPLLASLALLLLALCSVMADETVQAEMANLAEQLEDLMSIVVADGGGLKTGNELRDKLVANGLLCAFEQHPNLAADLKQVINIARNDEEKYAAEIGVKCNTTNEASKALPEWKCFCTENNIYMYCAALKYKNQLVAENFPKKTCMVAAMASGKTYYTYLQKASVKLMQDIATTDVAKISNNEDSERAQFFCDAVDPAVTASVKAFFASDLYPSVVEHATIMMAPKGKEVYKEVEKSCEKGTLANTHLGDCVCDQEKGVTYCNFYMLGKLFVEEGYLKCGGPATFDKSKRPTMMNLRRPKKEAGDSNKDKAAATASLLVPLSAAAAMLLLR